MNKRQLEEIFLQHQPLIQKAVASQQVNVHGITADDVYQEVSIRLIKLLKDDREIENLSSYIYRTTANVIIDLARKHKKHLMDVTIPDQSDEEDHRQELISDRAQPDSKMSGSELQQLIIQAIESLPESRRVAVKMRLQGYSVKEMCDLTGWAFYKAENLSKRGMAALKDKLKQLNIDYEID